MNVRFITPTILLSIFIITSNAQNHATGLIFDDQRYQQTDRLSPALKFTETNVPILSLRQYCPTPENQGTMGSCVGFATGYGALTVNMAMDLEITSPTTIASMAKSALYIYNQIKVRGCGDGSQIEDALKLVQNKGDCKFSEFNPNTCNVMPTQNEHTKAMNFKIMDYYRLFDYNGSSESKILATIQSLRARKPVVIGMTVTSSINNVPKNGEWNPQPGERVLGGHALCVIGYNDITKRFEILNSWGTNWGNEGFFTISYADYGLLCKYGYQFTLERKTPAEENNLSGVFKFKKYQGFNATTNKNDFQDIDPIRAGNYYSFSQGAVKKDDFFRIVATNIQKDSYVYIFSIKPNSEAEILFPLGLSNDAATIKDIPLVPANNVSIEIPIDEAKGITTDQVGIDNLCILYSTKKIDDIEKIVDEVKNADGDFAQRITQALGDRLIPIEEIHYKTNEMSFAVKSSRGYIAPILLKVNVTQ